MLSIEYIFSIQHSALSIYHILNLLYFFIIFSTASIGNPYIVFPLIPVNVLPANNALIIASSVACMVAVNSAFINSLGMVVTCCSLSVLKAFLLATEKAR